MTIKETEKVLNNNNYNCVALGFASLTDPSTDKQVRRAQEDDKRNGNDSKESKHK